MAPHQKSVVPVCPTTTKSPVLSPVLPHAHTKVTNSYHRKVTTNVQNPLTFKTKQTLWLAALLTCVCMQIILRVGYDSESYSPIFRLSVARCIQMIAQLAAAAAVWYFVFPTGGISASQSVRRVIVCSIVCALPLIVASVAAPRSALDDFQPTLTTPTFQACMSLFFVAVIVTSFLVIPHPYARSLSHDRQHTFFNKRSYMVFIVVLFGTVVLSLKHIYVLDTDLMPIVLIVFALLWSVVVVTDYRQRNLRMHPSHSSKTHRYSLDGSYVLLLSMCTTLMPVGFGIGLVTIFDEMSGSTTSQVLVLLVWSLFMAFVYALWKASAIMALGPKRMSSFLVFGVQIFDDLFTDIIFLSVEPFGTVFYALISFQFFRDVARDTALVSYIHTCLSKPEGVSLQEKQRVFFYHYHLAEQNLFSEFMSSLVLPVSVGMDYALTAAGFGVNTITFSLTQGQRLDLLQMFGVLFIIEVVTHVVVRFILKRQLTNLKTLIHNSTVQITTTTTQSKISHQSETWNVRTHNRKYWEENFYFCLVLVVFSVCSVIYYTTDMKHRLNKT